MTTGFGGTLTLPATVSNDPDLDESLDTALEVLSLAVPAILTSWLSELWQQVTAGSTPIIQSANLFDPTTDFDISNIVVDDNSLPALFIFGKKGDAEQISDAHSEFISEISFLWLPDSRQFADDRPIDALFRVFGRAMTQLVRLDRDPAWVSSADQQTSSSDTAAQAALKVACRQAGSSIANACGFSHWRPLGKDALTRVHFTLGTGLDAIRYDGFLYRVHAVEYSDDDVVDVGSTSLGIYVPTSLEQSLNTGGSDPLTTVSIIEPPED